MAGTNKYFGCLGLGEIPELSFWVKVLFSLLFFTASKPFTFWLNCGGKQNLNDSTYVTQNYWALVFFFKDKAHERSIFGLSRFPFQLELAGMLLFPSLLFSVGASWDFFFFRGLLLLSVLEECSIAVCSSAHPINHDLQTSATVSSWLSQK